MSPEDYIWAFDWTVLAIVSLLTILAQRASEVRSKVPPASTTDLERLNDFTFNGVLMVFGLTFGGLFGLSLFINKLGYRRSRSHNEVARVQPTNKEQSSNQPVDTKAPHEKAPDQYEESVDRPVMSWWLAVLVPNLVAMLFLIAVLHLGGSGEGTARIRSSQERCSRHRPHYPDRCGLCADIPFFGVITSSSGHTTPTGTCCTSKLAGEKNDDRQEKPRST